MQRTRKKERQYSCERLSRLASLIYISINEISGYSYFKLSVFYINEFMGLDICFQNQKNSRLIIMRSNF